MILTAGELSQARADLAATLPDTCVIVRPGTSTPNDSGGWTEGDPTETTVACRFGAAGQAGIATVRELLSGGRLVAEATGVFTMPHDADVRQSDRITWNGKTFEVSGVPDRSENLTLRVFVKVTT